MKAAPKVVKTPPSKAGKVAKQAPSKKSVQAKTNSSANLSVSPVPHGFSISKRDFSKDPINARLKPAEKIGFLREMLRIRRFEQQALKYYNQGMMGGFLHLYIGQESVAVGTASLMTGKDEIITAYRDHGHGLAVGMEMNPCMAELFGKGTGCSKGKGGSMHFFAPDKHYWGGHGIVGGQAPLGMGLAFALKYKGIKGCAVAFLGDGAVNQGVFSACLNMAGLFELPVVVVNENTVSDANAKKYRSPEEIERYKTNFDPITLWEKQLLKEKVVTQTQIEKIDAEAKAEAAAAAEFAIASPWPSEASIFEDIYHEVDHQTEAGQTGRHFFSE